MINKIFLLLIHSILIIVTLISDNFAQNTVKEINPKNKQNESIIEKKELQIEAEIENQDVNVAEKIVLNLKIKNNSKQYFVMFYELSDAFGGCEIEIRDTNNKVVQTAKTETAKRSFGSRTELVLFPEDEINFKVILSEYYQLSIGKYSVIVSANFNKSENLEEAKINRIRISTEPIILTIK